MKKWIAAMMIAIMLLGCAACRTEGNSEEPAEGTARVFTDSCGRQVIVPEKITKAAVSGPLAQNVVFAMAPDMLIGLALEWDSLAEEYLDTEYYQLPVLGQLYGGKGEINLEELLAADPDVVIDIGEYKEGMAEDLDRLQMQTGIPFVHIDTYLDSMDETFTMCGKLLGCEEKAVELAAYWNEHYKMVIDAMEGVEKAEILYITGQEGLNVVPKGSYHGEVIDLFTENIAVVDNPSPKGSGNEVDMEQLLEWNPEYILFDNDCIYDEVGDLPEWQNMQAIANGRYYEVPEGPYNWMGFPPSIQRILGMMWMETLFYPEVCPFNLKEEVKECYQLFYHCALSDAQYEKLVAESIGKRG